MHQLRIALAQINVTVGDLDGNVAKILANVEAAKAQSADMVVFPELALTTFFPRWFIEDEGEVDPARAHDAHDLDLMSILLSGNSSQISGGVTSPGATERQDFWNKHYQRSL